MIEATEKWLAERPQLREAAGRAMRSPLPAVFYFLSHEAGWTSRSSEVGGAGTITPPPTFVNYFAVECFGRGADAEVFAQTLDDAIQLYEDWHMDAYGNCNHPCWMVERSRWLLMGGRIQLRKEMDLGKTGIAGWDLHDGWHIYPFDHEMAGE